MNDRVVVIIADADAAKACTGLMYAANALKHGWLADVKVVVFGPAENTLLADEDMQEMLREFQRQAEAHGGEAATACRFLSDRDGLSDELGALGLDVRYVGSHVSDLIKAGYVPMVW